MAAVAARAALADAGVGWQDVEFAAGGSDAAGNADTTVSVLGLTGVPFINVRNGCATGGSALATAHAMLVAGAAEVALVVGFDKHPPGAFNPLPEDWGLGAWYGETGLMLTTQFFAMKIQRYMAEHGITRVDARQGGREGVRQRLAQPERLAPQAPVRGRGARLEDGQPPADAVHVLLARRGRGRARAGARRARAGARARARVSALGRVPDPSVRVLRGVQPVDPDRRARPRPRPRRRPPRSSRRASGPRTSTSRSCRTPSPARRSCTSPRPACASTASRRR